MMLMGTILQTFTWTEDRRLAFLFILRTNGLFMIRDLTMSNSNFHEFFYHEWSNVEQRVKCMNKLDLLMVKL